VGARPGKIDEFIKRPIRFDGVYLWHSPFSSNNSVSVTRFFSNGRVVFQPVTMESDKSPAESIKIAYDKYNGCYAGRWYLMANGQMIMKWYAPSPDGYRYANESCNVDTDGLKFTVTQTFDENHDRDWKESSEKPVHEFLPVSGIQGYQPAW
jgi:hypothetical protein